MRKRLLAPFLGLLMLGGLVATASTASATPIPLPNGGDVSVNFSDFTYPGNGCYNHTGHLNLQAGSDDDYYGAVVGVDLTVTRTGEWRDGWVDDVYYSGSYNMTTQLCRSLDPAGSYTVSGTVSFVDWNANVIDVPVRDTFNVRAPAVHHTSSISAYHARYGAHGWALKTTARYDGRAWRNKTVSLQRYAGSGHWTTMRSVRTNSTGHATLAFTPANRTLRGYRVLLPAGSGAPAHATSTHWLRRR